MTGWTPCKRHKAVRAGGLCLLRDADGRTVTAADGTLRGIMRQSEYGAGQRMTGGICFNEGEVCQITMHRWDRKNDGFRR